MEINDDYINIKLWNDIESGIQKNGFLSIKHCFTINDEYIDATYESNLNDLLEGTNIPISLEYFGLYALYFTSVFKAKNIILSEKLEIFMEIPNYFFSVLENISNTWSIKKEDKKIVIEKKNILWYYLNNTIFELNNEKDSDDDSSDSGESNEENNIKKYVVEKFEKTINQNDNCLLIKLNTITFNEVISQNEIEEISCYEDEAKNNYYQMENSFLRLMNEPEKYKNEILHFFSGISNEIDPILVIDFKLDINKLEKSKKPLSVILSIEKISSIYNISTIFYIGKSKNEIYGWYVFFRTENFYRTLKREKNKKRWRFDFKNVKKNDGKMIREEFIWLGQWFLLNYKTKEKINIINK